MTKRRRVLLVNPPALLDRDFIDYPQFVGLGVASNAAALRARGLAVTVADAQMSAQAEVAARDDGRVRLGCDLERLLKTVPGDFDDVVVGVSPYAKPHARTEFTARQFAAARARFPSARLVAADFYFGGIHYIEYDGERFLRDYPQVDAVVKYEGESALAALLKSSGPLPRVTRAVAEDIPVDSLPYPAWDPKFVEGHGDLSAKFYAASGRPAPYPPGVVTLPAVTSRSCAYRCSFCTSNPGQSRASFRPHGAAYLRRYFSELKNKFSVRRLVLLDGCANYDPARFDEILSIIGELGLRCDFPNGLRADKLTFAALRALSAVSDGVSISAESGDPEVLSHIFKKGMDLSAVERVASWCRELRLPIGIHYIVGAPGETPESVNRTLRHALRMTDDFGARPLLQNFVPIPGTALYGECERRGLLKRFDAENLHRYFQGEPALSTPSLSRAKLSRMVRLFRSRLEASSLQKVIVNLTYHCNNNCRFCAVGDRGKRHGDFERYGRLLADYRKRGVTALDLDGGEPTLYPEFFPLVRLARRCGYEKITVTTNGRRLADRAFAARFLLSGISDLLISLHGHTPEIHEYQTRRKGSFAEAVQGLRHALRLKPGRMTVGVNTMLLAENARHLPSFLDFMDELGVEKVNVQLLTPFGNAAAAPGRGDFDVYGHAARALRRRKKTPAVQLVNVVPCLLAGHARGVPAELGKHGREMVFVDAAPRNLAAYLDARRHKTDQCRGCEFDIGCGGFHVFNAEEDRTDPLV